MVNGERVSGLAVSGACRNSSCAATKNDEVQWDCYDKVRKLLYEKHAGVYEI